MEYIITQHPNDEIYYIHLKGKSFADDICTCYGDYAYRDSRLICCLLNKYLGEGGQGNIINKDNNNE